MHELDELVVKAVRRTLGNATDDPGKNPVGNLACDDENGCDDRSLQVGVGSNQLGQLLDFRNQLVQVAARFKF